MKEKEKKAALRKRHLEGTRAAVREAATQHITKGKAVLYAHIDPDVIDEVTVLAKEFRMSRQRLIEVLLILGCRFCSVADPQDTAENEVTITRKWEAPDKEFFLPWFQVSNATFGID